jgi:hypothetical protein
MTLEFVCRSVAASNSLSSSPIRHTSAMGSYLDEDVNANGPHTHIGHRTSGSYLYGPRVPIASGAPAKAVVATKCMSRRSASQSALAASPATLDGDDGASAARLSARPLHPLSLPLVRKHRLRLQKKTGALQRQTCHPRACRPSATLTQGSASPLRGGAREIMAAPIRASSRILHRHRLQGGPEQEPWRWPQQRQRRQPYSHSAGDGRAVRQDVPTRCCRRRLADQQARDLRIRGGKCAVRKARRCPDASVRRMMRRGRRPCRQEAGRWRSCSLRPSIHP